MAALLLAAVAAAGCESVGVRRLDPGVKTLAIASFANATGEAALPTLVVEELRRAARLDGRLTVVDDAAGADAVLGGTITAYDRQPSRFDANNVVREYHLRLAASVSLKDAGQSRSLWATRNSEATGSVAKTGGVQAVAATQAPAYSAAPVDLHTADRGTTQVVIPASGLAVESEPDAQRRLARDLAAEIVLKMLEGW